MWKKLSDTNDLLSYEKSRKNFKVRIEARLTDDSWNIYKTYFTDQRVNFVEEYSASSQKEVRKIIKAMVKEKDLSLSDIKSIKKLSKSKPEIRLERAYKEYDVEKWFFSVGDDEKQNFITIRFGENIDIDVVLHEHYRFLERTIIQELIFILGLDKFEINTNQNVYFFNKKTHAKTRIKGKNIIIGKIEMGSGKAD